MHISSTILTLLLSSLFTPIYASTSPPQQQPQLQQPIIPNPSSTSSTPLKTQPLLGFGTWNLRISPENTTEAVAFAIETGYRQIDCAAAYGNEVAVGKGIAEGLRRTGLQRGDLWVTGKLWNGDHGDPETVEKALNQTLKDLNLDYLDLYLMHWPVGKENKFDYIETYKSLTRLPTTHALHIGISNFSPSQLHDILTHSSVKPFAHQMELHPYLQQSAWVARHFDLGIGVTAYSALGNMNPIYRSSSPSKSESDNGDDRDEKETENGDVDYVVEKKENEESDNNEETPPLLLQNPIITQIAEQHNCTPAQVALKWGMRNGKISVLTKSSHPSRIEENFAIEKEQGKCELNHRDLRMLRWVGRKYLKRFNNPGEGWGVSLFEGLDGV